jgi:hypothetical protein
VSTELKKQLRRELAPVAPPKMVAAGDDVGDALTQLQVFGPHFWSKFLVHTFWSLRATTLATR